MQPHSTKLLIENGVEFVLRGAGKKAGMLIERGKHAVHGGGEQLVAIDRLHVPLLDGREHFRKAAAMAGMIAGHPRQQPRDKGDKQDEQVAFGH